VRPAEDPRAADAGRVRRPRRFRGVGRHGASLRPGARPPGQGHRGPRVPLLLAEAGRGVERERPAGAGPAARAVARPVAVRRHHDRAARPSDGDAQDDQGPRAGRPSGRRFGGERGGGGTAVFGTARFDIFTGPAVPNNAVFR